MKFNVRKHSHELAQNSRTLQNKGEHQKEEKRKEHWKERLQKKEEYCKILLSTSQKKHSTIVLNYNVNEFKSDISLIFELQL